MTDKGSFLKGPAMRSYAAATGIPSAMRASSISTTTGPTTRTTTSAFADPRTYSSDAGHAGGEFLLGREFPGANVASKARQYANPVTATGPTGAVAEARSDFFALTSLDNLYACWMRAKASKGQSIRVQRFAEDPLRYLLLIQQRLRARNYTFGPYRTFTVIEKKRRDVVDAPMKDRIVHWMLYEYLLPIWQPRMIHDTYGNLPGRGTLAAVQRLAQFCRSGNAKWALQLDVSKYFYSVPHEGLKARALRYIGDHDVRQLLISLIDSYRTDDRYDELFSAESLYRTTEAKGMPIGNLSSQLFANIFLCDFDHWVKQTLCVNRYIRYVDDIVIVSDDRDELISQGRQITERLAAMGLTIHPYKARLARITASAPFLGYVVWPNHISAGQRIRSRYHRRLRQHERGERDRSESIQSYRSMLAHTGSTVSHTKE
ncbi:MAG: hypothetical protein JWN23_626 [Rhodocyclales bacterium]|nr:hypothetical protein [Rhodocyclales bacterium]